MKTDASYKQKFATISTQTLYPLLTADEQNFLYAQATALRFTLQELRQLCEITRDLSMWGSTSIQKIWPSSQEKRSPSKEAKKQLIKEIKSHWESLKDKATQYSREQENSNLPPQKLKLATLEKEKLGLGYCPVASPRTRCCNLMTLDAIDNSFYHENKIIFDHSFAEKLQALKLDPDQIYHIGTGQSSDSLMWGNKQGILDALCTFAYANPNVILELKTKSKNITYLLEHDIPANIICTWSLSTPALINNEEHRTASLQDRLDAARQVADQGILVGFHCHPMIHYDRWQEDYSTLFRKLQTLFTPSEVTLFSLGTLTFTKSVVKQIRQRGLKSKILQLPLVESNGKLTYPDEVKLEMFTHAYQNLNTWHNDVFFYLCMENNRFWQPVFGREYPTNEDFETAMKRSYMRKVQEARGKGRNQL